MSVAWLELLGVTRRFRDGSRGEVTAVNNLTVAIHRGETVALTGPSGAGKSTAVALAAGVLLPTAGEVRFDGGPFSGLREGFRARLRRRRVGVALQHLGLVSRMSALENVLVGLYPDGLPTAGDRTGAMAALDALGISFLAGAQVDSLSGGERQRVALARALAFTPDLLVLDEPTAHLDDTSVTAVSTALRTHAARGGGALVATHDPRLLSQLSHPSHPPQPSQVAAARVLDLFHGAVNTP